MAATKQVLSLKTINLLGGLSEEFDTLRQMLVQDCVNRPGINKARELTLVMRFTPAEQDPADVIVETFLKSKMPNRAAEIYKMQSTNNGGLKFQPDSPMRPDQDGLFDGADDDK